MDNATQYGSHHGWEVALQRHAATAMASGPLFAPLPLHLSGLAAMTPPASPSEPTPSQGSATNSAPRSPRVERTPPPESTSLPQATPNKWVPPATSPARRPSLAATHPSQYGTSPNPGRDTGAVQPTEGARQSSHERTRVPTITLEEDFLPDALSEAPAQTTSPLDQTSTAARRASDNMLMPPPPRPPPARPSDPARQNHTDQSQPASVVTEQAREQYNDPTGLTQLIIPAWKKPVGIPGPDAQIGVVQSPTHLIALPFGGMIEMANVYSRSGNDGRNEGEHEGGNRGDNEGGNQGRHNHDSERGEEALREP